MTDYITNDTDLTTVANAIRTRGGTSAPLEFPSGFATAIANIPSGTPVLQTKTKTYTPTESQQTESVTADVGYDGLDEVDVTVNAISSTYVGSGITRRSSSDLTASGATVSVPSGYYENSASKAVASGTAGTPTATKGAVSNHSVSVTPSVTNTTGFITGSTKTGTAVTVTASELVSGSETKTANGTYDVTNLAQLIVNVSGGASNVVIGTFTGTTKGSALSVTLPYTGSGYPIAVIIAPAAGAYNSATTYYTTVQRYAMDLWCGFKAVTGDAPYVISNMYYGDYPQNHMTVRNTYKSSTSNATQYTTSGSMNAVILDYNAASASATQCVKFSNATTMSVFIANTSYGFMQNVEYKYIVVYSS